MLVKMWRFGCHFGLHCCGEIQGYGGNNSCQFEEERKRFWISTIFGRQPKGESAWRQKRTWASLNTIGSCERCVQLFDNESNHNQLLRKGLLH